MIGGIKLEEGDFRSNIAVVGLGLIGGSFAMALRKHSAVRIYGIDIDESVLNKAAGCGVIDEGASNAEEILCKSDMVIIALILLLLLYFLNHTQTAVSYLNCL